MCVSYFSRNLISKAMRSTEAVLEKPAAADDVPEAVASDDDITE